MRFVRNLLGFSLLAAAVMYLRGRRKAAALARRAEGAFDDQFGNSVGAAEEYDIATQSGIANVDPEAISQVSGEGIDPVRDVEKTRELEELRERLPH